MMRHLRQAIIFVAALVAFSDRAHAFVELNGFYFSDTLSQTTATTNTRMNIEVCAGFSVDKSSRYLVGWGYNMMTASDVATATTTYSSTQMGPRFVYGIDKGLRWTLGLAYYLVTNAAYDDGSGTSVTWKGTALKFDIGHNFEINNQWDIGIRFNYSSASYGEQLIGATTYSVVSTTRSSMYPSIYSIYYF